MSDGRLQGKVALIDQDADTVQTAAMDIRDHVAGTHVAGFVADLGRRALHKPPSAHPVDDVLGELQAPAPDRLVEEKRRMPRSARSSAEAQRERVVKPDRMGDDRGREAVAMVQVRRSSHLATLADPAPAGHPPLT